MRTEATGDVLQRLCSRQTIPNRHGTQLARQASATHIHGTLFREDSSRFRTNAAAFDDKCSTHTITLQTGQARWPTLPANCRATKIATARYSWCFVLLSMIAVNQFSKSLTRIYKLVRKRVLQDTTTACFLKSESKFPTCVTCSFISKCMRHHDNVFAMFSNSSNVLQQTQCFRRNFSTVSAFSLSQKIFQTLNFKCKIVFFLFPNQYACLHKAA